MISASIYLVSTQRISHDEHLYQFTLDVLTVAEKKDYLGRAVNGDPTEIDSLKLSLPDNICFKLDAVNETGDLVFYTDTGCSEPDIYYTGKRSFVSNSSFYISTLRVWYK